MINNKFVENFKFAPYSYSRISTYLRCPKLFEFDYVLGIAPKQESEALTKGTAIHDLLENGSNSKYINSEYNEIFENIKKSFLYNKYIPMNGIHEIEIGLDKDLNPIEYNSENAVFRGKVDYTARINNILYIIDWKTGKYKEPQWQSWEQVMYYAIYYFKKFNKLQEIHASYVYIEHDKENSIILKRELLNNYIEKLINPINNIENDNIYQKNPSKLCDWCVMKDVCKPFGSKIEDSENSENNEDINSNIDLII